MIKFFLKEYFLLLFILCSAALFSAVVFRSIYPLYFSSQTLFFFDLLGFPVSLPIWLIYVFGCADIILIWLIGKLILNGKWRFLPAVILGFSPWFIYSVSAGSYYIYLLCLILSIGLSISLIKIGKQKFGSVLLIISSALLLYSSLIGLLIYILLLPGLILMKSVLLDKVKRSLAFGLIILLPLFFLMLKNPVGIKNIFHNQVSFLQDPGLLSSVNIFQGESRKAEFGLLSRFAENKYMYFLKYTILRSAETVMPTVFFTSEERLLGFSFSPPLYLGFLLPFLLGISSLLKSKTSRKYLLLSLILIIPAFVSQRTVDLNRLILFEPIIIFIIVFGLEQLYEKRNYLNRIIIFILLTIILFQFLVTLNDINLREYSRFERYYGISKWQIDKQ